VRQHEAERVTHALKQLSEASIDEHFQDGSETNLSLGIQVLFRRFPDASLEVIPKWLENRGNGRILIGHAIRAIGKIEDSRSHLARLNLIAQFLRDPDPYIRDAATIALSYMNDGRAVPYLRAAISAERNASLRKDMEASLEALQAA
jgi:hypothetical protein